MLLPLSQEIQIFQEMSIALTTNIRANLIALQKTDSQQRVINQRLSSGKQVETIVDNPNNFFASRSLNGRADRLTARLDGMGQSIQTINSANHGIDAIRSMISNMKALVNDALSQSEPDVRRNLGEQYNEVMRQISLLANDSSYQGVNLLSGKQTLKIEFDEQGGNSFIAIKGLDFDMPEGGAAQLKGQVELYAVSLPSRAAVASVASQASAPSFASYASQGYLPSLASAASVANILPLVSETRQSDVYSVLSALQAEIDNALAMPLPAFRAGFQATFDLQLQNLATELQSTGLSYTDGALSFIYDAFSSLGVELTGGSLTKTQAGVFQWDDPINSNVNLTQSQNELNSLSSFISTFFYYSSTLASIASGAEVASIGTTASQASQPSIASRASSASVGSFSSPQIMLESKLGMALGFEKEQINASIGLRKAGNGAIAGVDEHCVDWGRGDFLDRLGEVSGELETLDSRLRLEASRFSNILNTVVVRQDFSDNMIHILETGADKLVLADMNETGAEQLALQTRHQLAIQSLSLANQQAQDVLRMLV